MIKPARIWAAILGISLLFTACTGSGGSSGVAGEESVHPQMGRYQEKELSLPEDVQGIISIHYAEEGGLGVISYSQAGNLRYDLYQDEAFVPQETPWLEPLGQMEWQPMDVAFDEDGNPWVCLMEYGESERTCHVMRWTGSAFEEVEISDKDQLADKIELLPDGSFLLGGSQVTRHFEADGSLRASHELYAQGAGVSGDTLAIADTSMEAVRFFNLADGTETGSVPFGLPEEFYDSAFSAGPDGTFFFASNSGIYTCAPGQEGMTKVLDGYLFRMSSASLALSDIQPADHNVFYAVYRSKENYKPLLMQYEWEESLSARPTKNLRVCTLYDGASVREAAVEMQRKDPDLYVQVDPVYDEEAGTLRDTIRTINTEILAGRGADVYILDDMPMASYIEKGVLADLTQMAAGRMESGEWMKNIAGAFEKDGKIYAIPTRFGIPVVWGPEDMVGGLKDLAALADFANAHTDKSVFYAMHSQNILEMLYPVCAPSWRKDDGAIEEGAFAEYLRQAGRIASTKPDKEYVPGGVGLNGSAEVPAFLTGLNHMIAQEIIHIQMLPEALSALAQQDGGVLAPMPGQTHNVFVPHVIAGINAKTSRPDEARAYVEALLSDPVQRVNGTNYEGLPVNDKTLIDQLDGVMHKETGDGQMMGFYRTIGYGFDEAPDGIVILGLDQGVDQKTRETFLNLCASASVRSLPDPVLMEMITDETRSFFAGESTAEEAARAVSARTQAYLTE